MIKLLKGDDAKHLISIDLPEAAFADGMMIEFEIGGLKIQTEAAASIEVLFPATWTALQPLGRILGTVRLIDGKGMKATITKTFPVLITNDVSDVSAGSVISGTVKPVVDFSDIETLDETASPGEIKAALNEILKRLKSGISCLVFAAALPAIAADIGPTTVLDDIPGNTTISNLVASSGAAVGGGGISPAEKAEINTAIDGKVSKKGDTMTGPLTLRTTDGFMGGSFNIYGENGDYWSLQGAGFGGDVHLVHNNSNFAVPMWDIYDVATGRSGLYAGSWVETAMENASADATEALNLASAVSTVVIGEDCQLVSTNYNSATKMPSLFLRFQIPNEETGSNEWHVVWNEMSRWNHLYEEYLPSNFFTRSEVTAELDQKADRAWGYYDSTTGNYAPEGFTWVSSPSIAIAGGLAYQRVVTTQGAIWVLESNGMTTITGGETNGFFRISDDKGNAIFEITKGTEVLAGATAGALRTETVAGITHLYITYNVESTAHPTIEVCNDLKNPEWATETDESCKANVVWSGSSGAWVAEVWGKQAYNSLFVRASYKKGQRDIITNAAPVSFSEVVIGGVTYKVSVATIDGKKVMVLE